MPDPLGQAQDLFESGDIIGAAQILHGSRSTASVLIPERGVPPVAEIDGLVRQMRGHLNAEELEWFDDVLEHGVAESPAETEVAADEDHWAEEPDEIDLSPLGVGLALAGALAMLIAAFLPFAESSTFVKIAQNTLIQQGIGWLYIGLAIGGAASVLRAYKRGSRTWGPIALGVVGVAAAIWAGTSKSVLQLCPAGPGAELLNNSCEKAAPGVGIYLAGVGALLMIVGGRQIWTSKPKQVAALEASAAHASELKKKCPDCAELVQPDARVCRYCGFRFE